MPMDLKSSTNRYGFRAGVASSHNYKEGVQVDFVVDLLARVGKLSQSTALAGKMASASNNVTSSENNRLAVSVLNECGLKISMIIKQNDLNMVESDVNNHRP